MHWGVSRTNGEKLILVPFYLILILAIGLEKKAVITHAIMMIPVGLSIAVIFLLTAKAAFRSKNQPAGILATFFTLLSVFIAFWG